MDKLIQRVEWWFQNPICGCAPMHNDGDCFQHQIWPNMKEKIASLRADLFNNESNRAALVKENEGFRQINKQLLADFKKCEEERELLKLTVCIFRIDQTEAKVRRYEEALEEIAKETDAAPGFPFVDPDHASVPSPAAEIALRALKGE